MRSLFLSDDRATLHDGARIFDPQRLDWQTASGAIPPGSTVAPEDAIRWLYTESDAPRVPIGIIGPRDATPRQAAAAERLGQRIGALSIPIINGGKGGVMEAVSRGCRQSGGCVIGLLPDAEWADANPYVTIPIATGIGKARNVLIAQASLALVAVGGELGTLSEMAFGRHFNKPVFAIEGAPDVPGVRHRESVDAVVDDLIWVILNFSEM